MDKLAILIPFFLLLAMSEWWLTRKTRPGQFTKENTVLNICIGAIDRILSLASFSLFVLVLSLVYDNFRLWTLGVTWYNWILAYVAIDFVSYWYHRCSHRVAILWCGHVTHHSSEHFNLTNSFRTSPFQGLYRIPFWIVLPLAGFSPFVLLTIFVASGLYDFVLHTQNFPKIKWLEYIFVTPSLHKVHHGRNDIYIDKNYGATFVIWDKMFGTFQDETEPVEYGILSKDYKDGDPMDAIFHHYKYLWALMSRSMSWKNRLKVLIMPPDWMPDDLRGEMQFFMPETLEPARRQVIYAAGQFAASAIGVIAILVFEQTFTLTHFMLYAALFLTTMVVSTKIFNHRAGAQLRRNEVFRNLVFVVLFTSFYWLSKERDPNLLYGMATAFVFSLWSMNLPAAEIAGELSDQPEGLSLLVNEAADADLKDRFERGQQNDNASDPGGR
jgi:alkylglycerol monooxygenase